MQRNRKQNNVLDVLGLIGHTPLIELKQVAGRGCVLLAKCEFLNPTGSLKDRMAYYMIRAAEMRGELRPGGKIVEATSGNTGISLAMIGSYLEYHVTAVMPASMSLERRQLMEMYGAEIVLTPQDEWMEGSVRRVEEMAERDPAIWVPRQFSNFDNVECHQSTTGAEIISQAGPVDAFIAGVGTGGTLMGVGRALKQAWGKVKVVAVEPAESPVLSGGKPGEHQIQGIGPGFVPSILEMGSIDEIITVSSEEAMAMKEKLAREEGLFVGVSSGANVIAAHRVAKKLGKDCRIVIILADSGDRYMSMEVSEQKLR